MKAAQPFSIVLVTAPDLAVARKLVRLALQQRLAACGNLVPGLESHYWWAGKLQSSREVLILFKTRTALLDALERLLLQQHPYDTPEIISLQLNSGTPRYLAWIQDSASAATHASKGKSARNPASRSQLTKTKKPTGRRRG